MPYRRSEPLARWSRDRRDVLRALAAAGTVRTVSGAGPPRRSSRPLAHAFVIGVVSEFQGFARDLHDLAVERLVEGADDSLRTLLSEGLVKGRGLDRGNPDLRVIKGDFDRIGLTPLDLSRYDGRWRTDDASAFTDVLKLRNVLVHRNERELRLLRTFGVLDTVTWARARIPAFNRVARALDLLVWDHLRVRTGREPWR